MDGFDGLGALFFGLPGLVIYIAAAAGLAWWLLEPINRVAGQLQMSTRFMLTDVLGLMALLQVPLAIAGRGLESNSGDDEHRLYWFFLGMVTILAVVLWVAAISVVSRAGITRLWQRLCVIVLLVPGTTTIIILWPIALILIVEGIRNRSKGGDPWSWDVLALPALVASAFFIRRASFWVLKGSPGESLLHQSLGSRPAKRSTTMLPTRSPADTPD